MAVFNPGVSDTQDPNFLNWSKPISQPGGDKSTGIALDTAATGLGEGLKLADNAEKSIIEDKYYADAHAIMDDYTQNLQRANYQVAMTQAGVGGKPGEGNILDTSTSPGIPEGLKNLNFQFDSLGNARANGKLSETGYAGQLDALLKDYRARYPGYKEFIDETAKKVTGIDSANKLIQSTLQDINSFATNANQEKREVLTMAQKPELFGNPRITNAVNDYLAGKRSFNSFYNIASGEMQQAWQFRQNKESLEDYKGDLEKQGIVTKQAMTAHASNSFSSALQGIIVDPVSGQNLPDFINSHKPGSGNDVPSPMWAQLGQLTQINMDQTETKLRSDFNKPLPQLNGKSMFQVTTPAEREAVINDAKAGHKLVLDAIQKKDVGLMYGSAMMTKASAEDTVSAITKKYPVIGLLRGFNDINPEFAKNMYGSVLQSTLSVPDKQGIIAVGAMLQTQPGLSTSTKGFEFNPKPIGGQPYTMSQALDDTAVKTDGKPSQPGGKQLQKAVTEMPAKVLLDPKSTDSAKINMLRSFDDNYINKIEGMPSKTQVFTDMTRPEISKEVWRLGQKDPEAWKQYRTFVSNSFTNSIAHQEILSINDIQTNPNIKLTYKDGQFYYGLGNNINPYVKADKAIGLFGQNGVAEQRLSDANSARAQEAGRTVTRLNQNMISVREMLKQEGSDPDAYFLQVFSNMGVKLGPLTQQMQNAIISSHAKPSDTKTPITDRALPYSEEDAPSSGNVLPDAQRSSLTSFLGNPAGVVRAQRKNAPVVNSEPSRGNVRGNLSDENILGVGVTNVPEGADINKYLRGQ